MCLVANMANMPPRKALKHSNSPKRSGPGEYSDTITPAGICAGIGLVGYGVHAGQQIPDLLKDEGPNLMESHCKGLDVDLRYHGLLHLNRSPCLYAAGAP